MIKVSFYILSDYDIDELFVFPFQSWGLVIDS